MTDTNPQNKEAAAEESTPQPTQEPKHEKIAEEPPTTESSSSSSSSSIAPLEAEEEEEESFTLICKYGGQCFPIPYTARSTVLDVKTQIKAFTNVLPDRQKIVGLTKGKLAPDDTQLCKLGLKKDQRFMMIGTPEDQIPQKIIMPEFSEDDEGYQEDAENDRAIAVHAQNIAKVQTKILKTEVILINPPRKGKRLLVLDIDYTIFDCKSTAETIHVLKRPYLDNFLTLAYKYYDLVFWSQTSWRWIEAKLTEMGILLSSNFKVTFVLDKTSMPTVEDCGNYKRKRDTTQETKKYQIKPLQLIWDKFPDLYTNKNTIHVDDLSRNFLMNQENGLKISAYKNAPTSHASDRELLLLGTYLLTVKDCVDFRTLKLAKWREHVLNLTK
eukprot:TRINITY_DN65807_c5_g1_i1.p1 TRINITY_DN65807_c5_g1~~TRINITY_DN65807_c5_g1_i1.p1  ORF type:complete len:384 (-),score=49.09 TRINITY_DN65807_c5_g1_i1:168-1319(-)